MRFYLFYVLFLLLGASNYALGGVLTQSFSIEKQQLKNSQTPLFSKIHTRVERFMNENDAISSSTPFLLIDDPYLRYFVGFSTHHSGDFLDLNVDWTYSFAETHHYFRPFEVALKIPRTDGRWVIGRYLLDWDWADSFWNRGLWQPFHREDALRAKQGGLIGFFREFSQANTKITLFGSPFFAVEAGPHFEEINGQLVSQNPWFVPPPDQKIGLTNIRLAYNIPSVPWTEFLQLSLAGKAQYKSVYFSYAYKPMNLVRPQFPLSLQLDKEPQGDSVKGYTTPLVLTPVFLKHHIATLGWIAEQVNYMETGARQTYRLKGSVTYNHPEKFTPSSKNIIFFQPLNEWHFSVKGELHIKDAFEETVLDVSYTQTLQDESFKSDMTLFKVFPNITEQQFFRNDLFQFSQAVSVGLFHFLKWTDTESTRLKARLIYHFIKKYFLFSSEGSITIDKSIRFFISGDILFTEFPFYDDQLSADIDVYKNRTRIIGGVSYAF